MSSACQGKARLTTDPAEKERLLSEALIWNSLASGFESAAKSEQTWRLQRTGIKIALGLASADDLKDIQLRPHESGQLIGFSNAIQLLESGDAADAHELLLKLVLQNPHDYSAWYLLGKTRHAIGRDWEADGAFSTCIALNPDCWVAWQDRATVRLALRRFQDAAADCARLKQLRPDLAAGDLNLALLCCSICCSLHPMPVMGIAVDLSAAARHGRSSDSRSERSCVQAAQYHC